MKTITIKLSRNEVVDFYSLLGKCNGGCNYRFIRNIRRDIADMYQRYSSDVFLFVFRGDDLSLLKEIVRYLYNRYNDDSDERDMINKLYNFFMRHENRNSKT